MLGLGKCLAVFLAIWTTTDCRLPASVRPTSYTLKLNLSSGLGGSPTGKFRGSVSILFNLTETLSNNAFSLHASNGLLVQKSLLLFHTNYGNVQPEHKLEQNMTAGTVTVAVMAPTEPGRYTLALDFEGEFQQDLSGFYRASYMDNGIKRWMASTQFESSSARKAFPCFDDPRMRAKLSLAVILPTNLHAVSNTPVLNTTYNTDGSKTIRFQDSPAMPTYLFGWYIGDGTFGELASLSVKGIRYGIHGRTSLKGEEAYALEAAPKVIEQMETFTGVPYNNAGLTKMDQVAVPDFNAGAMENWGFVTYREFYILLNQTLSTVGDKQRSLLVISHEFAHQWFGDSVTLDWWSYTWLNEAFARYFQYFVANKIEPSWKLEEQFLTDVFQLSMASDYDSHPLSNMKTETVTEIEDNFDVITYSKGASILRMFSHILGEVGFKQWLSKYLTTVISKGRVATPDDLWAALPDPNLAAPFKTWTEVGDHPVVHVTGSASQGLRMTQFKEAVNSSRLASKLQIPISVVTFSGPVKFGNASHSSAELSINGTTQPNGTEYFWMRSNDTAVVNLNVIQPQRDWYLVSANAAGYYRVLYDEANWNALSAAIYMSEIPVVSRAQLISDALNLMASGYLAPATAWSFAEFLKVENDLIVWKSALMAFGRIRDVVAGWKNATDVLATRVGNILDQAFEPEDLYSLSPQNHSVLILKSYKASHVCYYRTKLCQALRDFPSSHQSEIVKLDRQLDGALLCELVKSDPWMWTTLLQMYHNATSPSVKRRYLSSLSCTTNSTHQQELLNYVLDPSVIPRQDYGIVVAVSEVENGSRSVMEFIKRNGTQLARYWSNKEHVKRTLSSVARKLHTPKMLDELDEILQSTDLGLSTEENNAIISKARRAYEERSMVAARICRALGVVCNAPEDSKGAAISSVSNVFLTSTLTIICLVFWL